MYIFKHIRTLYSCCTEMIKNCSSQTHYKANNKHIKHRIFLLSYILSSHWRPNNKDSHKIFQLNSLTNLRATYAEKPPVYTWEVPLTNRSRVGNPLISRDDAVFGCRSASSLANKRGLPNSFNEVAASANWGISSALLEHQGAYPRTRTNSCLSMTLFVLSWLSSRTILWALVNTSASEDLTLALEPSCSSSCSTCSSNANSSSNSPSSFSSVVGSEALMEVRKLTNRRRVRVKRINLEVGFGLNMVLSNGFIRILQRQVRFLWILNETYGVKDRVFVRSFYIRERTEKGFCVPWRWKWWSLISSVSQI